MQEKIVIPHMGILVTTYCNLNCRNCSDLIPKRCGVHYKPENVKSDMLRILGAVLYIEEVLIIGGETLLYPWLEEIIEFCGEQKKIGKLIITTNGTTIPSEAVTKCLRRNNVCMRVSGYPEHVAHKREEVVEHYITHGIKVENLERMQWADIGTFEKRNRAEDELQDVFQSCVMAECVTLQKDGLVFYCSRSMSAYETDLYPPPLSGEYIAVRNEENLERRIQQFYNLKYLSTCDYCDGISCATQRLIPAAVQILDKKIFLELLSIVCEWECGIGRNENTVQYLKDLLLKNKEVLQDKEEYLHCLCALEKIYKVYSEENLGCLQARMRELVNCLTDDYTYQISEDIVAAKWNNKFNRRNLITVGIVGGTQTEDLLVENEELMEVLSKRYPLDYVAYNRLYIESELKRLEEEPIECVVSGLSYTQYGILKKNMPIKTVNLSVTGQDIPYSLLMAKKALNINPGINIILIPLAYYQGYYDISADEAPLHRQIVAKVDVPILGEKRNHVGGLCENSSDTDKNELVIYEKICDFGILREIRDREIRNSLTEKEYFNELFPEPRYGGLKFDFKTLNEAERWEAAKKTAHLNERVASEGGYREVVKYIKLLLPELIQGKRRIIFFAPPMTKYLYAAYSQRLKLDFEENVVALLNGFEHVKFIDLASDERFVESDFCDFEHLNSTGAVKLTAILASIMMSEN